MRFHIKQQARQGQHTSIETWEPSTPLLVRGVLLLALVLWALWWVYRPPRS